MRVVTATMAVPANVTTVVPVAVPVVPVAATAATDSLLGAAGTQVSRRPQNHKL